MKSFRDLIPFLEKGVISLGNFSTMAWEDSDGTVRNMIPSINGSITYDGTQLVDGNFLTTQLASKQNNLTAGPGISITAGTIKSYDLKWNTSSSPSQPIDAVFCNGFTTAETAGTFIAR